MGKSVLLLASMGLGLLLLVCGMALAQGAASVNSADTTQPFVTSTIPAPRGTCVDPAANVSAFFSEEMQASSIDATTVRLHQKDSTTQVAASVRYGAKRDRAIIDPTDPLEVTNTYRVLVTTYVKDVAGNRLDQDGTLDGPQRKVWTFTTSADSQTPLECRRVAVQNDLSNAATAASACADNNGGSYVGCTTIAQLQPYGLDATKGVMVNGIKGNVVDWSASMQHAGGGSAYTYATFGENAGEITQAPRGTSAPALPDRTAEWEALARHDLENVVAAASLYAADNFGTYTGMTVAQLQVNYGFVPSKDVIITLVPGAGGNQFVAWSKHSLGGSTFQYDSATGEITRVPSS